jgi:hypothetical protein
MLSELNECCPEIPILYDLTQGFATVFRGRQSETLRRDDKEVNATAVLPWSNSRAEDQIQRLKLVKRNPKNRIVSQFDACPVFGETS